MIANIVNSFCQSWSNCVVLLPIAYSINIFVFQNVPTFSNVFQRVPGSQTMLQVMPFLGRQRTLAQDGGAVVSSELVYPDLIIFSNVGIKSLNQTSLHPNIQLNVSVLTSLFSTWLLAYSAKMAETGESVLGSLLMLREHPCL